jgi:hypothetical protein
VATIAEGYERGGIDGLRAHMEAEGMHRDQCVEAAA